MGNPTRKRKLLITLAVALVALIVLLVSLPLWFPWILKPVLKNFGVHYANYERDGFNQFILRDVKFANAKVVFQAGQIRGGSNRQFKISNWSLDVLESEKKKGTNSVYAVSRKLDDVFAQLNRWITAVSLTNGVVHFQKKEFAIPTAEYSQGTLSAELFSEDLPATQLIVQLSPAKKISLETPAWDFKTQLGIHDGGKNLNLRGDVLWQSNRVELAAQFSRDGSLPETASIEAKSLRVPAQFLKLQGYRDLTGSLDVRWQTNKFAIDLIANAQPIEGDETILSPVDAVIHATGDTNSVRIETATISAPWLQAKLSENTEFSFTGQMLSPVATLDVAVDLAQQKWIVAVGKLRGKAVLRRSEKRFPDTTFDLSGEEIAVDEIQVEQIQTQGKIEWPLVIIESVNVRLKDGATAQANLRFDAVARAFSEGNLKLNGQFGHQFLPPEISYKNISFNGKFSGPLKKISHAAHVELQGVNLPNLAPLNLVADWEGNHLNLKNFEATVAAKDSVLSLTGSLDMATNRFATQFQKMDLVKSGQPILTLTTPFAISATRGTNWSIEVEPARWQGGETNLSIAGKIQWPRQGKLFVSAQKIDSNLARDFFSSALPEVFFERVNASADWTNGPVDFDVTALARFRSEDGTLFSAEVQANGNTNGISIARAVAGTESESVLSGKGFLPITIEPANRSNLVQVLPKQRIDFQAATLPNPQFWERIARWTRADLIDPKISIAISGTVDSPTGKIMASANEIILKPPTEAQASNPLAGWKPALQSLHFQKLLADFDLVRDRIALNRFEIFVEGQPVRATGELPLPENFDGSWKKIFDWRKANAHLQIVDAQIAPFARLFPEIVSPLGTINLDVRANHGRLNGEFRVADAALRPIATLGSVHDISARAKFSGDDVKLETFQGSIGGQPVELSGKINLAKRDPATELPIFNFKLTGTNVPLARRAELILRSDVDLNISNEKGGQPLISGDVNLRDSFFLSDLKILIPGKVAKPSQRPPYFSVENEPLANWRLNVAVRGNEFLRVRSPLFRGEISANFKVEGTLREPVALGDARINSGVLLFPFANLRVEQGFVSLTSENPYRPRLAVSAASRTFGYDVKMDISGFADQPTVEFSSNPGLTSEQILLMVAAGELPRDEINFSSEQKAGRVAFFLGKNLLSKFGGSVAAEDRLEIRSGEEVSEQGQQTYYLEYKLSDDWSIVGEYDRFGGVNAGFKWKFFQK